MLNRPPTHEITDSPSGSSVYSRKAAMIASSSMPSTVERVSLGPVGKSLSAVRFFHLATVF
jgi:hypothetical protein